MEWMETKHSSWTALRYRYNRHANNVNVFNAPHRISVRCFPFDWSGINFHYSEHIFYWSGDTQGHRMPCTSAPNQIQLVWHNFTNWFFFRFSFVFLTEKVSWFCRPLDVTLTELFLKLTTSLAISRSSICYYSFFILDLLSPHSTCLCFRRNINPESTIV